MKKLLFGFSSLLVVWFAGISSPIYARTAETDLDLRISLRGLVQIPIGEQGHNYGLFYFAHPVNSAPRLCGLVEDDARPVVTTLYRIHQYDSGTNLPIDALETIKENPSDYASVVGFSTNGSSTGNILVPAAPFSIGNGKQVMVYYASSNEIFIMYNTGGGIRNGYGIHIMGNFTVRPELLALYNQLNAAGRVQLPALGASEILGTAHGDIQVAIRDTGGFMDPRWKNDWWDPCNTPAKANTTLPGTIDTKPPLPNYPSTVCDLTQNGDRNSRPVACQACNIGNNSGSCATSFTVTDHVSWQRWMGPDSCTDATLTVPHLVTTTWGGTITINPKDITIPFVGKEDQESESKYLADYFEGTNEYYKNYEKYWLDYVNYAGVLRKLTPMTYQDTLKEQMVARAVRSLNTQAPFEGKIHDYMVNYPTRLCWDAPFIMEISYDIWNEFNLISLIYKKLGVPVPSKDEWFHHCLFNNSADQAVEIDKIGLILRAYNASPLGKLLPIDVRYYSMGFIPIPPFSDLEGHKKLSEIASHLPPSVNDSDYEIKWATWKKSTWGRIWEAVPLVSREDTEGLIQPYLGAKNEDTFTNLDPTNKNQVEKVPHLARLYESSKIVSSILIPYNEPITTTAQISNNQNVLADNSSTNNPLTGLFSPKSVQAATPPPCQRYCTGNMTFYDIDAPAPGQHSFKSYFCVPCPAGQNCDGISHLKNLSIYDSGGASGFLSDTGGPEIQCPGKWETQWGTNYHPSTINMNVGDAFTVSANWTKASGGSRANCCVDGGSVSCSITLAQNADGTYKWDTTCGVAPAPPPTCFQDPAKSIDSCIKKDAITGTGDTLCCSNIQYKLTAVDKFENNRYVACNGSSWACQAWLLEEGKYDQINMDPCLDLGGRGNGHTVTCEAGDWANPNNVAPDPVCVQIQNTDNRCYEWTGREGSQPTIWNDSEQVSRNIGVSLIHPYLDDIWNQTSGSMGVLNIFRPSFHPGFPDTPAISQATIKYTPYSDQVGWCSGNLPIKGDCPLQRHKDGSTSPTEGQFYFPHLGGIQQAKQWVTNSLFPASLTSVNPVLSCSQLGGTCTDSCAANDTLGTGLPGGDGCGGVNVCCKP
ncbi:hypothetical protein COT44_03460 [Candidatus Shapirobacteria bacterium CG08_land_8_20_14_0_20_39_18]|uniref:Uncharacterized protein n=1 Tax=Candidatus Shapirobacteria bacterium CG08_land_8_20_14_0_20_39_18 TaxID=1974883 RepID=A0A2M6XCW7_9BACT|nr:MAG: hypothetical protein COT44_03460 [Candidatus Shapirobacteria bacterium CG08_land_8_20_14_0_20_39_18]PIY65118.1 MAG: hypothetical protein COY91_03570 [Candidatus Shapirobacteria bacterium CG_4_10_14_0_8_um_filter_39_15]